MILLVVRVQQGDMGIPLSANVDSETERVVFGKAKVIRSSFIYEGERAGRSSVPGIRRNYVERGSQLRLKELFRFGFHIQARPSSASYTAIPSIDRLEHPEPTTQSALVVITTTVGNDRLRKLWRSIWLIPDHRELTVAHVPLVSRKCESCD